MCAQKQQGGIVKLIEKHTKGSASLDDDSLRNLVQVALSCALASMSVRRSFVLMR